MPHSLSMYHSSTLQNQHAQKLERLFADHFYPSSDKDSCSNGGSAEKGLSLSIMMVFFSPKDVLGPVGEQIFLQPGGPSLLRLVVVLSCCSLGTLLKCIIAIGEKVLVS